MQSDSYGEDIAETETDESSGFDTEDEYGDDFIDDDDNEEFYSSVPNSGGNLPFSLSFFFLPPFSFVVNFN